VEEEPEIMPLDQHKLGQVEHAGDHHQGSEDEREFLRGSSMRLARSLSEPQLPPLLSLPQRNVGRLDRPHFLPLKSDLRPLDWARRYAGRNETMPVEQNHHDKSRPS
jgi:hypothetical protein